MELSELIAATKAKAKAFLEKKFPGMTIVSAGSYLVKNAPGGGVEITAADRPSCNCCQCRGARFAETDATRVFEAKCETFAVLWSAEHEARKLERS